MKHLIHYEHLSDIDAEKIYKSPGIVYVGEDNQVLFTDYGLNDYSLVVSSGSVISEKIPLWEDNIIWNGSLLWGEEN